MKIFISKLRTRLALHRTIIIRIYTESDLNQNNEKDMGQA
jgi:hypothetical protein